jgi:hypothetical protein
LAWFGDTGGVVVGHYQRRRIVMERAFDNLAWVHRGPVNGAVEEFLETDDPITAIEKQARKNLMGLMPQFGGQVPARIRRAF